MAASFDPERGFAGAPHALFKTRVIGPQFVGTQYDVGPDGRFLIHSLPADYASPLTLLTGWSAVAEGSVGRSSSGKKRPRDKRGLSREIKEREVTR